MSRKEAEPSKESKEQRIKKTESMQDAMNKEMILETGLETGRKKVGYHNGRSLVWQSASVGFLDRKHPGKKKMDPDMQDNPLIIEIKKRH